MNRVWFAGMVALAVLGGAPRAQVAEEPERMTVAFSDPSRPGTVTIALVLGSVEIRGADRRDVLIEARTRRSPADAPSRETSRPTTSTGRSRSPTSPARPWRTRPTGKSWRR